MFSKADLQRLDAPAGPRIRVLDGWLLELHLEASASIQDALNDSVLTELLDDLRLMRADPTIAALR